MPIQHTLWTIDKKPSEVKPSELAYEKQLEDMIQTEPRILSDEWMLIGRQIHTGTGGRVDLLAIAADASLVLIELKRGKTPGDVIAQTLDYAAWLEKLNEEDVAELYEKVKPGASLIDDFQSRFDRVLEEEDEPINHTYQLVVVAQSLDASSERIVRYLQGWGIPINVLTFEVFQHGDTQFLSRAWLVEPLKMADVNSARPRLRLTWNNEYYACFGHGENRDWDEARRYGFISAGGGTWHTNSLKMLCENDRVWVKVPRRGFVGVGRITGPRESAMEFTLEGRPALDVLEANHYRTRPALLK